MFDTPVAETAGGGGQSKAGVRPSPDSGLAMSSDSSGQSPLHGGGGGQLTHTGISNLASVSTAAAAAAAAAAAVSATPPLPGSNLVVRPQPARSPYEWMKRPGSSTFQNRPAKEGEVMDGEFASFLCSDDNLDATIVAPFINGTDEVSRCSAFATLFHVYPLAKYSIIDSYRMLFLSIAIRYVMYSAVSSH